MYDDGNIKAGHPEREPYGQREQHDDQRGAAAAAANGMAVCKSNDLWLEDLVIQSLFIENGGVFVIHALSPLP